jgi:hypothetical protein
MERSEQIRQKLKQMAMELGPKSTLLGTVKSVAEAERTCVIYDDDLDIDFEDVRLRPVLDGNDSLVLLPKVNSWALAVRIEDEDDWMLIAAGEFEKILITCDQVVFNDGANGGLVNWPDVKAELDKTNAVVNAIKNSLLNFIPVPGDGGAALKTLATTNVGVLTTGDFNGKEDEKIKH